MHELPIVKEVLQTVLRYAEENDAKKVTGVILEVGGLHDLIPEWVEKFFEYASRGTIAEGSKIRIVKNPIILHCKSCGEYATFDLSKTRILCCSLCNSEEVTLVSGKEFMIRGIEVS